MERFKFPQGEAENLSNDFVNAHEDVILRDLQELVGSYTPGSYWHEKMMKALDDEMWRRFGLDDDHEQERDNNENFDRWIKGEDL